MNRNARQDGASAVEFAIVLPVLVMLVFGIIQFGLTFGRLQGMHAAAREGARLASIGRTVTEAEVRDRVQASLPPLFADTANDIVVTISRPGGGNWCDFVDDGTGPLPNELVQVTVSLSNDAAERYAISIPYVERQLVSYVAEGVFRCEAPRS